MAEKLATDKTYVQSSIWVSRDEFNDIFTKTAIENVDKLVNDITTLKDDIADILAKPFVEMENKAVCFCKEAGALIPNLVKHPAPTYYNYESSPKYSDALKYKPVIDGFEFSMITENECMTILRKGLGNPYQNSNGQINGNAFTGRNYDLACYLYKDSPQFYRYNAYKGNTDSNNDQYALITVHRLYVDNNIYSILSCWLENNLIPPGLKPKIRKKFVSAVEIYAKISDYVEADGKGIHVKKDLLIKDIINGVFKETVAGISFDIEKSVADVMEGKAKYKGSPDTLKKMLLECDYLRADIQPYNTELLHDTNKGHWELFEMMAPDCQKGKIEVHVSGQPLIARPPQLDVVDSGICAIDFGTKSTVVACKARDERLLRIGMGKFDKEPELSDYENPTVIALRDINSFMNAYLERSGRPFTRWSDLAVSHFAAQQYNDKNNASGSFNSIFSELKQWANGNHRQLLLSDKKNENITLKPFLELKSGDFDPIELYAYYLGLYINNMHKQTIFMSYIMSFPVNYKKDIREKIRQSFERGIRKSLPPAILADDEVMEDFEVYIGASEPAAYAVSALRELGLEPKNQDEEVAYAVFDFGGGTTDFDFGMERLSDNRKCHYIIDQFGANGDETLGGENLLNLMAYEVYKANIDEMRKYRIPFVLPPEEKEVAGGEGLLNEADKAGTRAFMNNRRIGELVRCIWEEHPDYEKQFSQGNKDITLFTVLENDTTFSVPNQNGGDSGEIKVVNEQINVSINIKTDELKTVIRNRIKIGVENFFRSMLNAFKRQNKNFTTVHILLAGNSCRSPIVKELFEEKIKSVQEQMARSLELTDGEKRDFSHVFVLHLPLGMKSDKQKENIKAEPIDNNGEGEAPAAEAKGVGLVNFDKVRTGKTGVAFGLLRSRNGGRDVRINNMNVDEQDEVLFQYLLGEADWNGKFHVCIGHDVEYNQWAPLPFFPDERKFELYYTKEQRALDNDNRMSADDVSRTTCKLDKKDVTDDEEVRIYLRKTAPDTVEYMVATEDELRENDLKDKTIYTKKLD